MPKERFRRALRGYDPKEVDAAIDARDARLARLEREAQRLAERVVEREKKLQEALTKPVAVTVTKGIEEIYGQARRQATRIRMKALDDAVLMADRVAELTSLRDDLGARIAELAEVARTRLGFEAEAPPPQLSDGSADGMYAGRVEVEVGPLRDFAQLTGFEDAAAGIGGASEIHVKRFSRGRATVSMNLADPVQLLRELEERAPFDFVVRDVRSDGLVLEVDQDQSEPRDRAA
ncbi:MAG TPA: DivIVA domain-containing protein [Solirubrobacterales bacterium]|nr:DivIVA domain-containing protein [Solirubrobacterales bacterium]